jgi:hypothetical protein
MEVMNQLSTKGAAEKTFKGALLLGFLLIASPSFAIEGTYQVAIKKQEEKKQSRWSLTDWLAQKQKNRMMDLWLAKNSQSSPFEFFLELESVNYGASLSTTPDEVKNRNIYSGELAAYAGLAGLRGGYAQDSEERSHWNASLNLRLFGKALQDTHLNLEYGLRGLTYKNGASENETFQNQFAAATLNLYFTKFFGIEGVYRKLLPAASDRNTTLEGESVDAGVFIDFSLLRVYGTWRKESLKFDNPTQGSTPGSTTNENREGFGGGLRLYF